MSNKTINRVRVIVDFPGYKIGDILKLDTMAGLFHFTNTTKEDGVKGDAFDIFASQMTETKPSLSKKEVLSYMDTLFEDISTYKVRSLGALTRRVDEIKEQMEHLKSGVNVLSDIDKEEALTVWQNMIWEYEWIMGMRELYYNDVNGEVDPNTQSTDRVPDEYDPEDFLDGNALEEEKDESTTDNTNRESY